SSTFTLTILRRPAWSRASSSRIGLTNRHGPHQGAHRSTTTVGAAFVSTSNVVSLASTTQGRGLPHVPQWGAPRSAGALGFLAPQSAQVRREIGRGSVTGTGEVTPAWLPASAGDDPGSASRRQPRP